MTTAHWALSIAALFWIVLFAIPWRNNGGYGFEQPYNLTCWVAMILMILPVAPALSRLRYSTTSLWLAAGAALMTLPVLWAPSSDALESAFPRLVGMWGAVMFYFATLQIGFNRQVSVMLLSIVAMAAMVQMLVTLLCLYAPQYLPGTLYSLAAKYGRQAFGTFEQRNVNASFLATGLGALLVLLAFSGWGGARKGLLAVGIVALCTVLVLCQSRIGWIGGVVVIIAIFALANSQTYRVHSTFACRQLLFVLPVIGIVIGLLLCLLPANGSIDMHDSSNIQRWLTLKYTLDMIAIHPVTGWGLGSFGGEFQRYMASLAVNPSREYMAHPHNEVFYQWFEGGVCALTGCLCWTVGWIKLALRQRRCWQYSALVMTLPILLHTQVEYPLWFSVPHVMLVLLLLRIADSSKALSVRPGPLLPAFYIGGLIYAAVLVMQCLYVGQVLSAFEASRLDEPESIANLSVPWLMQRRWQHEITMLRLVRFHQNHEKSELTAFINENARWLAINPEPELIQTQRDVQSYLKKYL